MTGSFQRETSASVLLLFLPLSPENSRHSNSLGYLVHKYREGVVT